MIPGIMVARKQAKTDCPPTQPYSIIDMLGGISRPKTAQLEMREPINPFSYPFSSSLGDIIEPIHAIVAPALPDIAPNTALDMAVTMPSPPLILPKPSFSTESISLRPIPP